MPNTHLREASRILFGDPLFAERHVWPGIGDVVLTYPGERRKTTLNALTEELKDRAE